jgi:hypothetical protein
MSNFTYVFSKAYVVEDKDNINMQLRLMKENFFIFVSLIIH